MDFESFKDNVAKTFKGWGSDLLESERTALREKVNGYSLEFWRMEHIGYVLASGVLFGVWGFLITLVAITADLLWCKKVGTQACLGIGLINGCEVDFEEDMNHILAIWSGLAEAAIFVPAGKVGIKVSKKILPKVAGMVVEKLILKGGSKIGMKLAAKAASKATTKLIAKLMAKYGGCIPVLGGAISAGINVWLLTGLMDAAEAYYKSDYLIIHDEEIASLIYSSNAAKCY